MLHSAASPKAAALGREMIARGHQATLVDRLEGSNSAERAGLFLALGAGLQVMRQTMALPSLTEADPSDLARLLEPVIRSLIGGPQKVR